MKRIHGMIAIVAAAMLLVFAACSNSSDGGSSGSNNGAGYGTTTPPTATGGGSEGTGGVTTYTVTVAACSNGTVIASPTSAAQDATVTLTINPASGYELDTISVLASANPVTLSGTGNARTFTMPAANVTVTVAFKTLPAGFVRVEGATIKGGSKFANNGYTGVFIENRTWMFSDFFMCDHEVTQAEYQAVMNSNPSKFTGNGELPVEMVSWYDAIYYCNKKSIDESLTPCYSVDGNTDPVQWGYTPHNGQKIMGKKIICIMSANGYRLPTEAEWEYAALGGKAGVEATDPTDWAGTNTENELKNYAWYADNSDSKTHAVKTKTKNGLGLFDMSGNVYEWCWEGNSNYHIRRGGCWSDGVSECSVAAQMPFDDNLFQDYGIFGLRVVRTCRDYKHAQFAVFLQSFDSGYKISVIKAVKALTNLGLGEAKALVEGAPRVLIEGLSEAEADKWIADIAEAGGTASKI